MLGTDIIAFQFVKHVSSKLIRSSFMQLHTSSKGAWRILTDPTHLQANLLLQIVCEIHSNGANENVHGFGEAFGEGDSSRYLVGVFGPGSNIIIHKHSFLVSGVAPVRLQR